MSDPNESAADDAALTWDGDEPDHVELPTGWRAVGKGSERVSSPDAATPAPAADDDGEADDGVTFSNASLLGIGLFAGIYLLYTIGWYVAGQRLETVGAFFVSGDIPFAILTWAAILAPAVWFAVSFVLTLHARTWVRFAALAAGALLLAPWPALGGAL